MKTVKLFLLISLVGLISLSSCKYDAGDVMPSTSDDKIDSISYALGLWFGNMVEGSDFGELNLCKIRSGFLDKINDKDLEIVADPGMIVQAYVMERQTFVAERTAEEAKEFFEKNKTKEGVIETESGLQYKLIEEGEGLSPELTGTVVDTVEVNYVGTLLDGTEFDSSKNIPVKIPLDRVVAGWPEGLKYVKEGGKIELYIPAALGFGGRQMGPIPPNSSLLFNIELVKVYKGKPVEPVKQSKSKKNNLKTAPY